MIRLLLATLLPTTLFAAEPWLLSPKEISTLAANGSALDLLVADIQGDVKLVQLPPAKAKRSQLVLTAGYRTTGVRAAGVKIRGGNGHNAGGKVG